jgi:hypothetical protein
MWTGRHSFDRYGFPGLIPGWGSRVGLQGGFHGEKGDSWWICGLFWAEHGLAMNVICAISTSFMAFRRMSLGGPVLKLEGFGLQFEPLRLRLGRSLGV